MPAPATATRRALALVAAVVGLALAACGSNPAVTAPPDATSPTAGVGGAGASGGSPGASTTTVAVPPSALAPLPDGPRAVPPEQLAVEVLARYPHDPGAFTQGLLLHEGRLFESTGLVGRSTVREVEVATGRVVRSVDVPRPHFAEGLALVGGELVQLTWVTGVAFRYGVDDLELRGEHRFDGEGWGLCFDGDRLVHSDGSATLTFRDPHSFERVGAVEVRDDEGPVRNLNELECVAGAVYANVWRSDRIARIDPASGNVSAWIDASELTAGAPPHPEAVLNGIAYDEASDTFLVTGKWWPELYRVRFVSQR